MDQQRLYYLNVIVDTLSLAPDSLENIHDKIKNSLLRMCLGFSPSGTAKLQECFQEPGQVTRLIYALSKLLDEKTSSMKSQLDAKLDLLDKNLAMLTGTQESLLAQNQELKMENAILKRRLELRTKSVSADQLHR